jgi:hypothetical protein
MNNPGCKTCRLLFLTPANATTWIWGVGPIFQLPTASSSELGTGRWSAGPTAALIYSEGPWFNGVLAYQLMSFAGNRERGSVNQTFLEPDVSYNFESGWYVQCEPSITYGHPEFESAGRRVRPSKTSQWCPAMDCPGERNTPFPDGH